MSSPNPPTATATDLVADARRSREAQQEAQRAETGEALYPGDKVEPDEGRGPDPASILDPTDANNRLVADAGDVKVATRHPAFDAGADRAPGAAPPDTHLVEDDRSDARGGATRQ